MNSSSGGGGINIAASARKIDVDNRIALRYYYRIADNIIRQADIFRAEKNVIDLYVMLLRFSSLITETIPRHQDYRISVQSNNLKKKLLNALSELEELKPTVQLKIDELNNKRTYQASMFGSLYQNDSLDSQSQLSFPTTNYRKKKIPQPAVPNFVYQSSWIHQSSHARPVDEQIRKLSLNIPRPKEETLSKHSILGPNGLSGQWQPPLTDKAVQYPSNLDLTPVTFPSLQWPVEDMVTVKQDNITSEPERRSVKSILKPDIDSQMNHSEEVVSMISFEMETPIIRQPSPPPVLAEIQDLIPAMSSTGPESGNGMSMSNGLVCSESPLQLHISTAVMESFMKLAKSNTDKNLETCGVLAGSLKNRKFYVTALIIPKQESTSDSCHTTNEEEIFEVQDKQSLFPLGWIHTHPTQSCFMSSIDVHTQYSYQIMLPEAIAIVMAPRDGSRKHGIFRLTTPGGMSVIRKCPRRGFHSHEPPAEGGPIYDKCTDVFINPNIDFDVIDLR